ncbi:hypothetical protein B0H13DRAFT_2361897 [Mycena leptocephala]|nr:hypothetical protein B0H13DRAFT_2361897 [Mycena leptocephala]
MSTTVPSMDPRLPPELEHQIFEIAAHEFPEMIPIFLRVARRIQFWIEPLLYQVILAAGINAASTNAVLAAMDSRPRTVFNAVRHLYIDSSANLSQDQSQRLLGLCENVVNLALVGNVAEPSILPILAGMRLRQLSVSLHSLFGGPDTVDLNRPLFISITHLKLFVDNIEHSRVSSHLSALPALTHLCLMDKVAWEVLRDILSTCKPLEVLVNMWATRNGATRRRLVFAFSRPFADFVFDFALEWFRQGATKGWKAGADGGNDFWAAAENLIARRRRLTVVEVHFIGDHIMY